MAEVANHARRELLELSARLDAIASRLGERGDPVARDAAAQISAEAGSLRRVLDSAAKAARDTDTRVEPPIDEVVDELRKRR